MKYTRYNDPPYSPICRNCTDPSPDCFFYSRECASLVDNDSGDDEGPYYKPDNLDHLNYKGEY